MSDQHLAKVERVFISGTDGLEMSVPKRKASGKFTSGQQHAALRLILLKLKQSLDEAGFTSNDVPGGSSSFSVEKKDSLLDVSITEPFGVAYVTSKANAKVDKTTGRPEASVTFMDSELPKTAYVLRVVKTKGACAGLSSSPTFIAAPRSTAEVQACIQQVCLAVEECFGVLPEAHKTRFIGASEDVSVTALDTL